MSDIENKLRTTLYRAFCPGSAELGEYHLEMLPQGRRRAIRAHLMECPHCTRELEQLRGFLESVRGDLEPGPVEKLRRLIAHLVDAARPAAGPDSHPATWAPALAGVRGSSGEGETLNFAAEGYQVILDIQADAGRPDRKAILGLLMGEDPSGFRARLYAADQARLSAAGQARLSAAGSLVAEAQVDEFGNFALNPVPPGTYSLTLSGAQTEIQVEQLTIR
jgi:hypothetical protein